MYEKIGRQQIYELIIHNLPIGFSIVDKEGFIVDFNDAAELITGFTKSEVIGKSHFKVLHGTADKKVCPLLEHALLKHEGIVESESAIQKKNGDQIIISVTAFPLIDDAGVFLGGVELFRDITESRKLARERKNILSMFAHDMKNPAITSGGLLSRLLSGKVGEVTAKQQDYLEIVGDNLNKLEKLVTNFLEFSRLETKEYKPKPEPFNLAAMITRLIKTIQVEADKKNIEIIFNYSKAVPEIVRADSTMMDRVITNLLSNSIKYTEPNGSIEVILSSDDKNILFQVIDTGTGIPENQLPFLFDAFFQVNRDSKGSGLGLAISKTIIEAHGGRIWVESTLGAGTTFSFTLPKRERGE